jgi:hypothetical protein
MGETMQASGQDGLKGAPDGVAEADTHGRTAGESQGGAYPNPHTGKKDGGNSGPLGHGGQTDITYHGGGSPEADGENANATTKGD